MGRQNRADAEAKLSWDRVVNRYLSTYYGVRRLDLRAASADPGPLEHLVVALTAARGGMVDSMTLNGGASPSISPSRAGPRDPELPVAEAEPPHEGSCSGG